MSSFPALKRAVESQIDGTFWERRNDIPRMTSEDDFLTRRVIGAALQVHTILRQGLLESSYEQCLCLELDSHRIPFVRQLYLPIRYKSTVIENAYKVDLLVNSELIVEIKSVEKVLPVHKAQVRTYLIHAGLKRGLLFNFNVESLKSGIYRISV